VNSRIGDQRAQIADVVELQGEPGQPVQAGWWPHVASGAGQRNVISCASPVHSPPSRSVRAARVGTVARSFLPEVGTKKLSRNAYRILARPLGRQQKAGT
jgi:hypothetical protein